MSEVVDLESKRREREERDGRRGNATSLHDWSDTMIADLTASIHFPDDDTRYVLLRTSQYVPPSDTGYALTPSQARTLGVALIEMAQDVERDIARNR